MQGIAKTGMNLEQRSRNPILFCFVNYKTNEITRKTVFSHKATGLTEEKTIVLCASASLREDGFCPFGCGFAALDSSLFHKKVVATRNNAIRQLIFAIEHWVTTKDPARRCRNQKRKVNHKSIFNHEEHEEHEGHEENIINNNMLFFNLLRALRVLRGKKNKKRTGSSTKNVKEPICVMIAFSFESFVLFALAIGQCRRD